MNNLEKKSLSREEKFLQRYVTIEEHNKAKQFCLVFIQTRCYKSSQL